MSAPMHPTQSLPETLIVLPPLGTPDPFAPARRAARDTGHRRPAPWALRLALCLIPACLGAGLTLAAGALPPGQGGPAGTTSACGLAIGAKDEGQSELTVPGPLILG